MNREEEKKKILDEVKEYAKKYLSNIDIKDFKEGDRIPYSAKVYDEQEVVSLVDSALDFWLTQGKYYDEFEDKLSRYLGVRYVSFVNSGSSANLLAYAALTSPLLKDRQVKKGDEVITVASGFPTTVAPIIQLGQLPVFVDMDIPTYNADVSLIEKAITDKTKVIIMAHTLGNAFDIKRVKELCDKHNIWLIEDNCDALGCEALVDGIYKKTGTIGDIGTSSFYPPHHMTTGEGG
ncbi:MAG: aminotransferase class V-fold PLP-dependent enzyme, partial [Lachnospiraceae bacterium]|nr:aminotransferase class V-fold PLP-dependent enzyme [Lachnospiraceae bacterium]